MFHWVRIGIKIAHLWNILLSHRYAQNAICCRLTGPAPRTVDGSSPAQFVLLISHFIRNVMQCKEVTEYYMQRIFVCQLKYKICHLPFIKGRSLFENKNSFTVLIQEYSGLYSDYDCKIKGGQPAIKWRGCPPLILGSSHSLLSYLHNPLAIVTMHVMINELPNMHQAITDKGWFLAR